MKIDSSIIGMESARRYTSSKTTVRHFVVRDYREGLAQGNQGLHTAVSAEQDDGQEKSGQAKQTDGIQSLSEWQNRFAVHTNHISIRDNTNTMANIRQLTVRYIFQLLFGGSKNSGELEQWLEEKGLLESDNSKTLSYEQETWYAENEDTSFSTVGTVRTADGREINFNVNVGMSRRFRQSFSESLNMVQFKMCDPLVINLDTDIAQMTDQTFYFDIDADGEEDEISGLAQGSGYLALDKNGDGVINDGSELFGTKSGDGFADLAKYDEDGNGWIDENDKIWSKLKIWTKDENGKDVLYRLAEKGVGAVCLQNASTDFTLTGSKNQTQGAIRSTGIFLYENGTAGTVQHVDVAKYSKEA